MEMADRTVEPALSTRPPGHASAGRWRDGGNPQVTGVSSG